MLRLTRRQFRFTWLYLRGRTPWNTGIVPPEIVAWLESAGRVPGRALDLGCGTGTTSLFLARQGWQVVGVDFALPAVRRARREARRQGLDGSATFIRADVSRPDLLREAAPFDLAVDIGCLHGLTPPQQTAYAAHLVRLLRPGAIFLLYAFLPRPSRDGSRMMGLDAARLTDLFGAAFALDACTLGEDTTIATGSGWYTLRRTEAAP